MAGAMIHKLDMAQNRDCLIKLSEQVFNPNDWVCMCQQQTGSGYTTSNWQEIVSIFAIVNDSE